MSLAENQINDLEKFISTNVRMTAAPAISTCDLIYGKRVFREMENIPGPEYKIFGSDGCGSLIHSLYKSKENKMYIISLTMTFTKNEAIPHFDYYKLLENDVWFG